MHRTISAPLTPSFQEVCCSVLQFVAEYYRLLQNVAVWCSALSTPLTGLPIFQKVWVCESDNKSEEKRGSLRQWKTRDLEALSQTPAFFLFFS